jgi:hypothetical protein
MYKRHMEIKTKIKSNIYTHFKILGILLPLVLMNCDLCLLPDPKPVVPFVPFIDLSVKQEWQYLRWEKPYSGDRAFTGDTVSVSIIDRDNSKVIFYERTACADANSPADTATICFQIEDSYFRQVGINRSKVFGFVANHGGILIFTHIDSNLVTVNIDTALYLIREQTGKGRFIGNSDSLEVFSELYHNVNIYYDDTPLPYDGIGHLAIFSPEEGILSTIYFGGFSPVEQFGYQLIRSRKHPKRSEDG